MRLPTVLFTCLVLWSAPAVAQQSDQERTALARSLFEEGVALGNQGEWAQAADRYRRVLTLRPTAHVKFNLALALSHLGQLVEPAELCRQVIRDPAAPESARRDAQDLLSTLEPRIGRLTVRLTGDPEGAAITLDGDPLDAVSIGVAMPADPGTHEVAARRGAEIVAGETVEIAEGGSAEVTLDIPPAPEPEVPTPSETASAGMSASAGGSLTGSAVDDDEGGAWWPWVLVGALVVAGGVVAVLLLTGGDEEQLDGNLMPGRVVFD